MKMFESSTPFFKANQIRRDESILQSFPILFGTCLFICQVTSTRRQRRDLFDLWSQTSICYN